MSDPSAPANRLADATSPYLQQHAHNPVDWWPWCGEALSLARAQDKPILLSIGYSACHWCHVMAHESFEDPETAALMNRLFVNIKVDREERPDLDKIYQTAHQLLTQRPGGWPLTVFLTPDDHKPFFAGTYFPREPRHGLIAFTDLMQRVEGAYREREDAIREQNSSLMAALGQVEATRSGGSEITDDEPIEAAVSQLADSFDTRFGGFGTAPKFPHPTNLELLLRHHAASAAAGTAEDQALRMAVQTLECMVKGGINDQLGGGFCRYSVDERWMIPHFEKMLYDNGPLLALCCDAWQITGKPLFRGAAEATADWVMREMQDPRGGYYSSLDADSEGHEGRFYVWDREQVKGLLPAEEYAVFAPVYGLDLDPNFEGRWHLHTYRDPQTVAADLGKSADAVSALLAQARERLFRARERRVRPGRDEKILTAWNGLMIKGMARAARVLGNDRLPGFGAAGLGLRPRESVAGRTPARHLQGRQGASQRLSGRLRQPHRRPAGAAASLLAQGVSGARNRVGRCPAGAFPGCGGRRLLLHLRRPRAPDSPPQAPERRIHPRRQRHRRPSAAAPGAPRRRPALSGGRARHAGPRSRADAPSPLRPRQPARRPG